MHQNIASAVKRQEYVTARMLYIILRRRLCDIIVTKARMHQLRITVMIQRTFSSILIMFSEI